jgi:hypothetical protein
MSARFIVGDTRAVTATLPDGSVDFLMTSPPFLALRSYLPADHPDKALEIGSEATPAAFIDVLLELSAEWRRVLAPHGSIMIELGDTYAGPFSSGDQKTHDRDGSNIGKRGGYQPIRRDLRAWPMGKSLTLIPEAYRFALVYGRNPHTGQPSPAGQWQARNVVRWVRPNPPVGALGKKWRPATSDLVVACPNDDIRYWDDVATRVAVSDAEWAKAGQSSGESYAPWASLTDDGYAHTRNRQPNPAGAPLLDHWLIVPKGYEGAHYAVYPPELCVAPIEAMCPRRVCRTCGRPSERETSEPEYVAARQAFTNDTMPGKGFRDAGDVRGMSGTKAPADKIQTTTGWSTCGCPGTDGIRLDGFHTGTGWRPGVVLDPFAGTGTTLAVATGHGRDAIGIDIDSRNADLALNRVGPLLLSVEHFKREDVA